MKTTVDRAAPTEATGIERSLDLIRNMVLSGELLPGQKVLQGELADRLNVSRIPVREALATLHAEGLLIHKPNTGFTVARFSSEDLSEIYLMRRLLETALIRSIDLAAVDVAAMVRLNNRMRSTSPTRARETYQRLNRDFHFVIFDCSPLELVRQEVSRLWFLSGFYRSLYLYETENSTHLQDEHDQIIEAVRSGSVKALIQDCDRHRAGTERLVVERLNRRRAQ